MNNKWEIGILEILNNAFSAFQMCENCAKHQKMLYTTAKQWICKGQRLTTFFVRRENKLKVTGYWDLLVNIKKFGKETTRSYKVPTELNRVEARQELAIDTKL